MLKNLCQIEYTIENKICRLLCDNDMPLIMIKEALFQFQKYVGYLEDQARLQQEQAKKEEPINFVPEAIDPPLERLDEV